MFLIGILILEDQKMGLRRIYVDNLIYKGVPGKINLRFPENKCIYTRTGSDFYDLDDIFRELIPDLLVDNVRFGFINDEEVVTLRVNVVWNNIEALNENDTALGKELNSKLAKEL